ncbi:hypothetical protein B0H16DRAFT_1513935 [Mycena metata]|uniref:DUF4211 domain-containing protein n=1 Tax=Mycena metata TaxID=1033252 RepID=A0AAD7JT98_9AGAR|nr:hypothetical protein B0H16DRAFT_1513935 [Mycena metata]
MSVSLAKTPGKSQTTLNFKVVSTRRKSTAEGVKSMKTHHLTSKNSNDTRQVASQPGSLAVIENALPTESPSEDEDGAFVKLRRRRKTALGVTEDSGDETPRKRRRSQRRTSSGVLELENASPPASGRFILRDVYISSTPPGTKKKTLRTHRVDREIPRGTQPVASTTNGQKKFFENLPSSNEDDTKGADPAPRRNPPRATGSTRTLTGPILDNDDDSDFEPDVPHTRRKSTMSDSRKASHSPPRKRQRVHLSESEASSDSDTAVSSADSADVHDADSESEDIVQPRRNPRRGSTTTNIAKPQKKRLSRKSTPAVVASMDDINVAPSTPRHNPPRNQVKSRTKKGRSAGSEPNDDTTSRKLVSGADDPAPSASRRNPPRSTKPVTKTCSPKRVVSPVASDFADPPLSQSKVQRVPSPVASDFADDLQKTRTTAQGAPGPVVSHMALAAGSTPTTAAHRAESLFASDDDEPELSATSESGAENIDTPVTPRRNPPRGENANTLGGPSTVRRKSWSSSSDEEEGDLPANLGNRSIRGKSEEGAASNASLTEVDDLKLPTPPPSTKPTPRQRKQAALRKLKGDRNQRSLSRTVPKTASHEPEEHVEESRSDYGPTGENEEEEEEEDTDAETEQTSQYEGSLIDDADLDPEAEKKVDAVLVLERNKNRGIEGHLAVFIEYIVDLHFDPELISKLSTTKENYFRTAINGLRRYTEEFANSIRLQSWKAPFTATLDLRPGLKDEFRTDDRFPTKHEVVDPKKYGCQGCWTRGRESCDKRGQRTLWTLGGTYDRRGDTFTSIEEAAGAQYERRRYFNNGALAPQDPYPPKFQLALGARCCNRAVVYHNARHYPYLVATRVKRQIVARGLQLNDDRDEFLDSIADEFKADLRSSASEWGRYQCRFDLDEEFAHDNGVTSTYN